jgi:hypothetical protein
MSSFAFCLNNAQTYLHWQGLVVTYCHIGLNETIRTRAEDGGGGQRRGAEDGEGRPSTGSRDRPDFWFYYAGTRLEKKQKCEGFFLQKMRLYTTSDIYFVPAGVWYIRYKFYVAAVWFESFSSMTRCTTGAGYNPDMTQAIRCFLCCCCCVFVYYY